ncbi:solute carrier family 35 member C2-like [Dysidea avara]|uniref:solute carrier family 35 member C2-like n=1 Tax=Dysidea avara TaxID=196820 RepID=UPI00332FD4AC
MKDLLYRTSRTGGLVAFYFTFSISLTFYNKWLMKSMPFPISLTMTTLLIKFFIAWLCRRIIFCFTRQQPLVIGWRTYSKGVIPPALASGLDIGLSNWSLLFITVSLYTMSKSTSIVFILIFSFIFRLEKPRLILTAVIVLIMGGLFMFTYESTQFDIEGFILVIAASVITGIRWTSAQMLLQKQELGLNNPINTVYHLQPVMILTLLPLAFLIDGRYFATSSQLVGYTETGSLFSGVFVILGAACMAFMLGVSEYWLVYHTSSLTLVISGVFKEVLTLSIATTIVEQDTLSSVNIAGMVICLMGITLHVILKVIQMRHEEELQQSRHIVESTKVLLKEGKSDDSTDEEEILYEQTQL